MPLESCCIALNVRLSPRLESHSLSPWLVFLSPCVSQLPRFLSWFRSWYYPLRRRLTPPAPICAVLKGVGLFGGYMLSCAVVLVVLLLYTPLGWQGRPASELYTSTPEMRAYADRQWVDFESHADLDTEIAARHPSGSLGAALLREWKMIPPPTPDLRDDVPVSPPLNAEWSMMPPLRRESDSASASASVSDAGAGKVTGNLPPLRDSDSDSSAGAATPSPSGPASGSGSGASTGLGPYNLGPSFQLVTFASAVYYTRLLNLIGSVHLWEPTLRLVVYDLGFTQPQVLELQCIQNLEVRPFNFTAYPPHVKNLFQYYFKPLLVYDALQHASSVLCLDSGIELRQSLRSIKVHLARDGYFLAGQPNTIGRKSAPESFRQLGVNQPQYNSIQFCAGGMFGFVRDSPSYHQVATLAAQCALKPLCYSPPSAGRDNHNFDQSINSILLYKFGGACNHNRVYREMEMSRCPLRAERYWPEDQGGVVLCIRRWHEPKPYLPYVKFNEQCRSFMCDQRSYQSGGVLRNKDDSSPEAVAENWMYEVPLVAETIEHTQGSHLAGRSPMAECLLRNHNSRQNCSAEIAAHQASITKGAWKQALISGVDYVRAVLVAGMRMWSSYILFAGLAYASVRWAYGRAWIARYGKQIALGWAAWWTTLWIVIQAIDAKFD